MENQWNEEELTDAFKGTDLARETIPPRRDLLRETHTGQSSLLKLADPGSEQGEGLRGVIQRDRQPEGTRIPDRGAALEITESHSAAQETGNRTREHFSIAGSCSGILHCSRTLQLLYQTPKVTQGYLYDVAITTFNTESLSLITSPGLQHQVY